VWRETLRGAITVAGAGKWSEEKRKSIFSERTLLCSDGNCIGTVNEKRDL
jgi:hypothetical protein